MIDPNDVTQPNASRAWKEEFLIFAICVAGKSAKQQAVKVDAFLKDLQRRVEADYGGPIVFTSPFHILRYAFGTNIRDSLEAVKMGQYQRITYALLAIARMDVNSVTTEQLEHIKGIGPKTARFFMLHTRHRQRVAVLDTHILKYLNSQGIKAPKSTPPAGKTYARLEQEFLRLADESGMSVADFDLHLWKLKGVS